MKSLRIAELLQSPATDAEVVVKGWVRTKRGNKNVAFIALNDGSCVANMQVVVDLAKFDEELLRKVTTGACLRVDGRLVASCGAGQGVEVQAEKIEIYGTADPETYPLQKKGHSLEFLRDIAYLRPRTNTFGAIFRIRHAMAYAIHKYFNDKGFYYLHTPLITASDCEGAGAMFQVTTLDLNNLPKTEEGAVDYSQDFFGRPCSLTVSGQLEGAAVARLHPLVPDALRQDIAVIPDILQQLPQPHEQHPAEAAAEVDRDHHQHAVLPVHQPDLHEPLHGPVAADIEGGKEDHKQDNADPGKLDRAAFGPVHRGHILSVATGYHREDRLSIIFYRKTIKIFGGVRNNIFFCISKNDKYYLKNEQQLHKTL